MQSNKNLHSFTTAHVWLILQKIQLNKTWPQIILWEVYLCKRQRLSMIANQKRATVKSWYKHSSNLHPTVAHEHLKHSPTYRCLRYNPIALQTSVSFVKTQHMTRKTSLSTETLVMYSIIWHLFIVSTWNMSSQVAFAWERFFTVFTFKELLFFVNSCNMLGQDAFLWK